VNAKCGVIRHGLISQPLILIANPDEQFTNKRNTKNTRTN